MSPWRLNSIRRNPDRLRMVIISNKGNGALAQQGGRRPRAKARSLPAARCHGKAEVCDVGETRVAVLRRRSRQSVVGLLIYIRYRVFRPHPLGCTGAWMYVVEAEYSVASTVSSKLEYVARKGVQLCMGRVLICRLKTGRHCRRQLLPRMYSVLRTPYSAHALRDVCAVRTVRTVRTSVAEAVPASRQGPREKEIHSARK